MRLKLNKQYELRGWKLLPFAIRETKTGRVSFLDKERFMFLYRCDGLHDICPEELPEHLKEFFNYIISAQIVSECEEGERLEPCQEYVKYDSRYIDKVQWSITGKCNFRCRHCFMSAPHGKLGELSYEECVKIIHELKACGIKRVALTGGEPLVRRDFFRLVDELTEHGIYVESVYSNGKLITDSFLEQLEKRGLHPVIHMSFDGVGWHDWLRGVDGAEKMVLDAFRLCRKRGFETTAEMGLHKKNINSFRESLCLLGKEGCSSLKINAVMPMGEWLEESMQYTLSREEVNNIFLRYVKEFFEEEMPIRLWLGAFFECNKGSLDYKIGYCKTDGYEDCSKKSVCSHARSSLYISPEGYTLPCMAIANTGMKEEFPNIVKTPLKEILSDSAYMKVIDIRLEDYLAHNPKCAECKYRNMCCAGCRGLAIGQFGTDYLAVDEDACFFFQNGYLDKVLETAEQAVAQYKEIHQV